MTKKLYINKILFITIFSLIFIFAGICFNFSSIAFADEASGVNVFVASRENQNQSSELVSSQVLNGLTVNSYLWQNSRKLDVTFDKEVTPRTDATGSYYEIYVSRIEFLKGYVTSDFNFISDDKVVLDNASLSNKYYDQGSIKGYENFLYSLNLDDLSNGIGGWGIYRFTLNVNGTDYVSSVYNIVPTMPDSENISSMKPEFTITRKGSSTSMHSEYVCEITNKSDFRYADTTKITWYAEGVSTDGTTYCLTKADWSQDLENFQKYLYESIDRTGLNFVFNDKDITGDWSIYCVYKPSTENQIQSDKIVIKTGFQFNRTAFIISIVCVAVVSTGIVTLVAFIKSKKEKVW